MEKELCLSQKPFLNRAGAISLAATIVIGAIIVELAITGAFIVYLLNNSTYGIRLSAGALAAAQTGIEDALMHLVRRKDLIDSASCPSGGNLQLYLGSPFNGVLTLGNGPTVEVWLDRGGLEPCSIYKITATGRSFTRVRKLEARASVDAETGLVTVLSIKEL